MSDEKDINQQEEITEEVEKNPEDVIEQTASDESIPSDEEIRDRLVFLKGCLIRS